MNNFFSENNLPILSTPTEETMSTILFPEGHDKEYSQPASRAIRYSLLLNMYKHNLLSEINLETVLAKKKVNPSWLFFNVLLRFW